MDKSATYLTVYDPFYCKILSFFSPILVFKITLSCTNGKELSGSTQLKYQTQLLNAVMVLFKPKQFPWKSILSVQ